MMLAVNTSALAAFGPLGVAVLVALFVLLVEWVVHYRALYAEAMGALEDAYLAVPDEAPPPLTERMLLDFWNLPKPKPAPTVVVSPADRERFRREMLEMEMLRPSSHAPFDLMAGIVSSPFVDSGTAYVVQPDAFKPIR